MDRNIEPYLFDNEIEAMNTLNDKSANIVKIIDSGNGSYLNSKGKEKEVSYMVLEYINGACLHSYLNEGMC